MDEEIGEASDLCMIDEEIGEASDMSTTDEDESSYMSTTDEDEPSDESTTDEDESTDGSSMDKNESSDGSSMDVDEYSDESSMDEETNKLSDQPYVNNEEEMYKKYPENTRSIDGTFKGLCITIHMPPEILDELLLEYTHSMQFWPFVDCDMRPDLVDKSTDMLENDCVHYILRQHMSAVDKILNMDKHIYKYTRSWDFYYDVKNGQDVLDGPWQSQVCFWDDMGPFELRVPVYHPTDVFLKYIVYSDMWTRMCVKAGGEEFDCYLPTIHHAKSHYCTKVLRQDNEVALSATKKQQNKKRTPESLPTPESLSTPERLFEGLEITEKQPEKQPEKRAKTHGMPRLKGVVGLYGDDATGVVGLLYEPVRGIPLSRLSVPDEKIKAMMTRIRTAYKGASSDERQGGGPGCWRGQDLEDIHVEPDGSVFFVPPNCRRAVVKAGPFEPHGRDFCDPGMFKVLASLARQQEQSQPKKKLGQKGKGCQQKQSSRASECQVTSWTTVCLPQRRDGKSSKTLPPSVIDRIVGFALEHDRKVEWRFGKYYPVERNGCSRYRTTPPGSNFNVGLAGINRLARWKFFSRQHFQLDVMRLHSFLASVPYAQVMERVTLAVNLMHKNELDIPWRDGINCLLACCPIRELGIHIYGYPELKRSDEEEKRKLPPTEPFATSLQNHPVLNYFKQVCPEKISKIECKRPRWYRPRKSLGSVASISKDIKAFWGGLDLEVIVYDKRCKDDPAN